VFGWRDVPTQRVTLCALAVGDADAPKTRQIGSTPEPSRRVSMNALTSSVCVEFARKETEAALRISFGRRSSNSPLRNLDTLTLPARQ
jgi:hypothetical protein